MQCLAGGGHSCYYNRCVDNYEKIKKLTSVCVLQKKVLFLQGIFRAQASQMMILPWD